MYIDDAAFLAIFLTLFLGGIAWAEGAFRPASKRPYL